MDLDPDPIIVITALAAIIGWIYWVAGRPPKGPKPPQERPFDY